MADFPIFLMVFAPALIAIGLIVAGVLLLRRPRGAKVRTTLRTVFAIVALVGALGIGSCYAMVFWGY